MGVKPGFHMIVTVGDASPRQARGHIGDGCVKWKHFLNDVADFADQTGTVRGRIERVMIVTEIVSICHRLIGDTSLMCRSRSPTVTIIWKPGLNKPSPSLSIDRYQRKIQTKSRKFASTFFGSRTTSISKHKCLAKMLEEQKNR